MNKETQKEKEIIKNGKKYIIRKNGSLRIQSINLEPSKTDQSFAKDCDVNEIIKKFTKSGQLTHLARKEGIYADVSQIQDLLGSYETVNLAHEAMQSLPSQLRAKLENDPAKLIEYLNDPKNDEEAIKLGLKSMPETPISGQDSPNPKDSGSKTTTKQEKKDEPSNTTPKDDI